MQWWLGQASLKDAGADAAGIACALALAVALEASRFSGLLQPAVRKGDQAV